MQNLPTLQAMYHFIQLFVQHVGGVVHCEYKGGRAYLNLMPRPGPEFSTRSLLVDGGTSPR